MKKSSAMLVAFVILLAGCVGLGNSKREGVSGSLVEYLYPDGTIPPPIEGPIVLKVPATIGLAFVPARGGECCGRGAAPTAALQAELLEQVRSQFLGRDYIRDIRVIPQTYLNAGKGMTTLAQMARLYGVDVVALVSYDQVAAQSERKSAFLYWTIAGAYVVKGNRHDVHTFIDTAVLDVRSQRLLFRAPGVDIRNANTTLVEEDQKQRQLMEASLRAATSQMIGNLDAELASFRERLVDNPEVKLVSANGRAVSAGALAPFTLAGFLGLLAMRRRKPIHS